MSEPHTDSAPDISEDISALSILIENGGDAPSDAPSPQHPSASAAAAPALAAEALAGTVKNPEALPAALQTQPPARRGPGRPSKAPAMPALPRLGIVTTPKYKDSLLELSLDEPSVFKNMFACIGKQMKCSKIYLQGSSDGFVYFNSIGPTEQLVVSAMVQGDKMNHFYCNENFWISLNYDDIAPAIGGIDKTITLIKFSYRKMDPTHFEVILRNRALQIECKYPITVFQESPQPDWDRVKELYIGRNSSDIGWVMPSHQFKKTHESAKTTSDTVQIVYDPEYDHFSFRWRGTALSFVEQTFQNLPLVEFFQNLVPAGEKPTPGNIMCVEYETICGKAVSAVEFTKDVHVYCSNGKSILVTFEGASVSILVEMRIIVPQ